LSVARFLCHRIAVMYFGRIVELGPTESIFSDPKHPYTRRLLEARHARPSGDIADDAPSPAFSLGSIDRAAGAIIATAARSA